MSKRLSASWTFETTWSTERKYLDKSLEELEELRRVYFDRWNWESGDPKDREEFEAIDKEIERRKAGADVEAELIDAMSKEITEEIDREILENLLKKR